MRASLLLCAAILAGGPAAARGQQDSVHGRFVGISAGLGVSLVDANDVVNYVNSFSIDQTRQDNFATAAEFFAQGEYQVSSSWGVAVEYSYLLKSYNLPNYLGFSPTYVAYKIHMPTLIVHYLIIGQGYFFKLGGGLGYHTATFTEEYPSGLESDYSTSGVGLKVQAVGNTEFDEHLYGFIGVDARKDFMGSFKDAAGPGRDISMDFFGVGVKFGLSYFF